MARICCCVCGIQSSFTIPLHKSSIHWVPISPVACIISATSLLLTNKDISVMVRGKLYSSCVRSSMLHGSENWLVRKENEVAHQQAEMRLVRWMCGMKLQDRVPSKALRERETRIRRHNLGTTAKQVVMVLACVAKRRQWLGEEMNGVWSGGCQAKR